MPRSKIMYIELKTHAGGHDDRGPARIGRVTFSKSGKSVHYRGRTFQRTTRAVCGNYFDVESNDEYWISGPKKRGGDRFFRILPTVDETGQTPAPWVNWRHWSLREGKAVRIPDRVTETRTHDRLGQ